MHDAETELRQYELKQKVAMFEAGDKKWREEKESLKKEEERLEKQVLDMKLAKEKLSKENCELRTQLFDAKTIIQEHYNTLDTYKNELNELSKIKRFLESYEFSIFFTMFEKVKDNVCKLSKMVESFTYSAEGNMNVNKPPKNRNRKRVILDEDEDDDSDELPPASSKVDKGREAKRKKKKCGDGVSLSSKGTSPDSSCFVVNDNHSGKEEGKDCFVKLNDCYVNVKKSSR